jgi:hypothetical protein
MMDQRNTLGLAVIGALGLSLSLLPGSAIAQQKSLKEQLIGTWTIVQCDVVNSDGTKGRPLVMGSNPVGQFIFTDNGRFSFQVAAEIPKFASGGAGVTLIYLPQSSTDGTMRQTAQCLLSISACFLISGAVRLVPGNALDAASIFSGWCRLLVYASPLVTEAAGEGGNKLQPTDHRRIGFQVANDAFDDIRGYCESDAC